MMSQSKKKQILPAPSQTDLEAGMLARFQPLLSTDDFYRLSAELERPLLPALRVNTLKVPLSAVDDWAKRYGWTLIPIPYCPEGFWVTNHSQPISQTLEYRMGQYYIQDAASMLPVSLFDLPESSTPLITLDLAASPGGKTTHLLSRLGDRGLVIANDSSADRITALRIVLQAWGGLTAAVTRFPGELFGAWYPETFDRVLLDAPCSMQNLRSTETHPLRSITDKERDTLHTRQTNLLQSALRAVRVGGQVVYATCTLEPGEDEAVLDEVLHRLPGVFEVEDLTRRMPIPAPGLKSDGLRVFDPSVSGAARMYPHLYGTSGFFSALLTKTAPVDDDVQTPPCRTLQQVGQIPLSEKELQPLAMRLEDEYGLDLLAVLEQHTACLWKQAERVYAIPQTYVHQFNGLPCQMLGLELGTWLGGELILSHEWCTRFINRMEHGRILLPAEHIPAWLRGEDLHIDLPVPQSASRVGLVVDADGRFMGRGKVLPGRLKNMLPRRAG